VPQHMKMPMVILWPEKTTTSDTPATASTYHLPQQLPQLTDADEDKIGDDFKTPPPTMMPTEETLENTKMTAKTLIVDPPTLRKPQTLTPSNADISNDADNDILTIQLLTMPPTTTLMATNTETTENTTIDDAPATTSSLHQPQSLLQLTGDIADNTEVDSLMPRPMTLKPTTILTSANDETITKTKLRISDRSTATDDIRSTPLPLMPPTVAITDDAELKFEWMILTMSPTPTSPTLLPDYLSPDSNTTDTTTHLRTTTINWVRDNFAPVFKALHCLEIEIVKLTNNVFAATSNTNTVYPQCHRLPTINHTVTNRNSYAPAHTNDNPRRPFPAMHQTLETELAPKPSNRTSTPNEPITATETTQNTEISCGPCHTSSTLISENTFLSQHIFTSPITSDT